MTIIPLVMDMWPIVGAEFIRMSVSPAMELREMQSGDRGESNAAQ